MAKYVPDIKTQRWVIIAQARVGRPTDDAARDKKTSGCPFCQGNEKATPPEVYRLGPGDRDTPGWLVRVVPNKYPITDMHEVIIHSPDDKVDIEALPLDQVTRILTVYRDRYRAHESDGQVLIFCNHGFHAGASLTHPHSQLVVVPKQINLDALTREPITNLVEEGQAFLSYCPDFSQWPFEMWIAPKVDGTKFGDLTDKDLPELASLLQRSLQRIAAIYNDPNYLKLHNGTPFGYNFYIDHATNWFLRIIPRFIHRAGFELGTGLNVNVVDPIEAAGKLKKVVI